MTKALAASLIAGTLVLAAAGPAVAHHSFAMFDQTKVITLSGTVREFQWTNPHAFIELDVANGGKTRHWSIELNSPNNLKRQGWHRTSLKGGETVSVRIAPLRNGQPGGLFLDLRKANGQQLDSGLPKNGTPVNVPRL
ncbi:hypothetical protein GRI75_09640 [Altererythrobacter soli]|uniref:Uncharacterized protein n=1 Tax=Croceibacterium soli TaxID=1739690 RepID=A0A6I4UT12_9SPHN|nr:DUF6152 family protein [Croceibacterium soli]MXP41901.1 hypothetical protein [Croceibacterium soli]